VLTAAIVLAILAVAYFVLTTLVDLHPLNNVTAAKPSERRREIALNAPIMLLPAALLAVAGDLRLPWLGVTGSALELFVVLGGLLLWWLPYLVGVSVPWATGGTGVSWAELYERTYAHTIIVLPRIGDRPRPNLEHMILHALLLAASVLGFLASSRL
jgi:hypothetical protein